MFMLSGTGENSHHIPNLLRNCNLCEPTICQDISAVHCSGSDTLWSDIDSQRIDTRMGTFVDVSSDIGKRNQTKLSYNSMAVWGIHIL